MKRKSLNKDDSEELHNKIITNNISNKSRKTKPQRYLGPSQLASCLGINQFMSAAELKNILETGYQKESSLSMQCGINNEEKARKLYTSYTKLKISPCPWKNLFYNKRIGGQGDGLIHSDNGIVSKGLEIKCHLNRDTPMSSVPDYYLVQVAAYMQIYLIDEWDFMSCCVNDKNEIYDYKITTVHWNDVKELWAIHWYPKIESFIQSVDWKLPVFK